MVAPAFSVFFHIYQDSSIIVDWKKVTSCLNCEKQDSGSWCDQNNSRANMTVTKQKKANHQLPGSPYSEACPQTDFYLKACLIISTSSEEKEE